MEEQVGIDRYFKIDTIGPYDKQGKIDAMDGRSDLLKNPGHGSAKLVVASVPAPGKFRAIPHSRIGWTQ